MSLFISDSSDGIISIKRQRVHSLKCYSAASIILTMKRKHESFTNAEENSASAKSYAQAIFPFATLPDGNCSYFIPSYICDVVFQHMFDDPVISPKIILAIAPYLTHSLTKLRIYRMPCRRINEIFNGLSASSLTSLDFANNVAIDDSLIRILTSSSLPSTLKCLSLSGCTSFMTIKTLTRFSLLHSLDLSQNYNLIFEYSHCESCKLLSLLTNFAQLNALDLHMSNFICTSIGSEERICSESLFSSTAKSTLQRLDLHINPPQNISSSKKCINFYTMLIGFKKLSYLDLSGWPFMTLLSKERLPALSSSKEFFGLYLTGVADDWGVPHSTLSSLEVSGFSNEEQSISTLQHYYDESEYMSSFLFNLAGNLLQNNFRLTTENIYLLTENLYKTIIYYFQKNPSGSNYLVNSLCCLASVTHHDDANLPLDTIQMLIELFAELLHTLIMKNFTDRICAQTIQNCCVVLERFASHDLLKYKLYATHQIFLKAATEIIARRTELLKSSGVCNLLFNKLSNYIFHFIKCIIGTRIESKILFGSRFKGIDILMEYISVKSDLGDCDDGMVSATSCLMCATYLCYSNCSIASSAHNSQVLCNIIKKKNCEIDRIIGTLENIAEFGLQYKSANSIANILPVVKPILLASDQESLENIAGSIATVVYFAASKEKWEWSEAVSDIDSLLDIAVATALKLNYKVQRNVVYSTLDYFYQCLSPSDSRIHLCVIWLLSNLLFNNPKLYSRMLNQDFLDKIKSLVISHPKSSRIRILSQELLDLHAIGSNVHD